MGSSKPKKLSIFNHKGGVGKTTVAYSLAWMLASKGRKVLMVDADPQCNLTGIVLGYQRETELEALYKAKKTFLDGLLPALEARPEPIREIEPQKPQADLELYLLPGNLRVSEHESKFAYAHGISDPTSPLLVYQNIPGSIPELVNVTADAIGAEYVIFDMNPSLGALNKNILMSSDYFIVPTNPSYFSLMALESLANILPIWANWSKTLQTALQEATYKFPGNINNLPRFLGTITQGYQPYSGQPSSAFQRWIEKIKESVSNRLIPSLEKAGMLLDSYPSELKDSLFEMAQIPNFKSLMAKSELNRKPIFALTDSELGASGAVLDNMRTRRQEYRQIYEKLADLVLDLTA